MIRDQFILDIEREMIVDNFAGGGGASCGIELALGRHVDVAINHDPEAVAMHEANHPQTAHHCESVWDVDPLDVTQGRPVGLAWFSPDCKHFSKAKGGKPREKGIRGLAWVVVRWAALVRPRVIILENVEEFRTWGPLREDGHPCPQRKGSTFRSFVRQLQELGYAVEHRELRACDYGAPTIRKRLFIIARCDGRPIAWPAPTHGAPGSAGVKARHLKPWRTAAECIDWRIPCPSIFDRARPLAEATLRRIARGIRRYVIEADRPFVVGHAAPFITEHANGSGQRNMRADEPIRTICAEVKGGHFALVAAFLAKHFGGNYTGPGSELTEPMHTITATDHHALITAGLSTEGHAHTVRAFLQKYYSEGGQDQDVRDPMHTIPCTDRFGLVTVAGERYTIADIGMRMLEPHELYAAQGFPAGYVIAPMINGRRLSKRAQVRMCGNSVSPPIAAALVRANVPDMISFSRREIRQMEAAA